MIRLAISFTTLLQVRWFSADGMPAIISVVKGHYRISSHHPRAVIEAALAQPSCFDFWLEYLHLQPDFVQWAETFDVACVSWQLDLCWRLLGEAR
jgi:hypothetical protein